jgi:hypothetical protein
MRSSAYIYEKKDYRAAFQWILDVRLPSVQRLITIPKTFILDLPHI